ncbi:MAG TPA: MBL fold metallo-hydrolase [Micromonosporaceae bacterium]|jgi:glyoxylase-like metal-dependent hydrolase (beta-lactamase superfamily II)
MAGYEIPIERRQFMLGVVALGAGALAPAALRGGALRGAAAATRTVGDLEVVALADADGPFFLTPEQAFPTATAADWEQARRVDPGAFGADGSWHLDFRCFAVRSPDGRITLIDAGVGPVGSPASAWAPVPGHLPEVLASADIDVADVQTVVLTHAHEDHVGWSVGLDGVPMFPNARYLIQPVEVAALEDSGDTTIVPFLIEPLRRTGQLDVIDGRTRLDGRRSRGRHSATMTAIPTPGHTPGHQSVVVTASSAEIVLTGDVLVHAVQLVSPDVGYVFESDQDVARDTRRKLLDRARDRRALLATPHLNRPFVDART